MSYKRTICYSQKFGLCGLPIGLESCYALTMYSVVGHDGQVYGPVDMTVLQQWVIDGRVTSHTILIDAVSGQHAPANTFMLVQPLFQNAPPLPSQTPPIQPARQSGNGNVQVVVNNTMPTGPYGHAYPNKSRMVAGLLALFLGGIGIHQFYLGKNGLGITMLLICLLTCGYGGIITGIWALINAISIFTGSERDADGRPLI